MGMIYAAIDPGLDGAICVLLDEPKFEDAPTLLIKGSKTRRTFNIGVMAEIIDEISMLAGSGGLLVGLEAVHAMPGQGVTSMFSMGYGMGLWEGILTTLRVPYEKIPPQRWKKAMMDGQGKEKDASRQVAMRLFPSTIPQLSRKRDHNRADALLMAAYLQAHRLDREHPGSLGIKSSAERENNEI